MAERPTEDVVRSWWAKNPALNVGVVLGEVSALVGIDVDDAAGEQELLRLSLGDLPSTLRFSTPGGGHRLLYRWPKGVPSRTTAFPATRKPLHFLAGGSLTVMPPSRHVSGGVYAWAEGSDNALSLPAEAPQWLVRMLAPQPPRIRRKAGKDDQGGERFGERDVNLVRARAWLRKVDPAISGQGGHNQLFKVCCRLIHGFDLDQAAALLLLVSEYNPRCEPVWTTKELEHKLRDAELGTSPDMLSARAPERDTSPPPASAVTRTATPKQIPAERPHCEESRKGSIPPTASTSVPMVAIEAKEVGWLWKNFIPAGHLTLLEGRKGTGKSTLSAALVAAFTSGLPLPGRRSGSVCDVLWVTAEEDPASAIRPRLEAAGADLGRVYMHGWDNDAGTVKPLVLPRDIPALAREITDRKVRLVILDPLAGFVDRNCDENNQQAMRELLQPLFRLAAQTGAAILGIRHLRKGTVGPAIDQGIGSVAISAVARVVLRLDHVQGSKWKRSLACVASNLGPVPKTLSFDVVPHDGSTRVEWGDALPLDAEELAADQGDAGERSVLAEAKRLLRAKLSDGWVPTNAIQAEAKASLIGERTLWKAKAALGIKSRRRVVDDVPRSEWGPPEDGWPKNS